MKTGNRLPSLWLNLGHPTAPASEVEKGPRKDSAHDFPGACRSLGICFILLLLGSHASLGHGKMMEHGDDDHDGI